MQRIRNNILWLVGVAATGGIVDSGQRYCYDERGTIECGDETSAFWGQDANYQREPLAYSDNGDGTVTDLNTGLMWSQALGERMTIEDMLALADTLTLGGYTDWRLPNITELYSLMNFTGITPHESTDGAVPYIDWTVFEFAYGDPPDRLIDVQFLSSTVYVSSVFGNKPAAFGINAADGRIKGYGTNTGQFYAKFVRLESAYDSNDYVDNSDGTVTDEVSQLMWMKHDSGTHDWPDALDYCESLAFATYDDWRLPDAKELQSLVDYTRSPDTTNSAAIDPVFSATSFENEGGVTDWGYYWTSTTHLDGADPGASAVYVCFGRCLGYVDGQYVDVHGAGSQRSDIKTGEAPDPTDPVAPQGDIVRIYNYARCVRGGPAQNLVTSGGLDPRLDDGTNPKPTPRPTPKAGDPSSSNKKKKSGERITILVVVIVAAVAICVVALYFVCEPSDKLLIPGHVDKGGSFDISLDEEKAPSGQ